MFLCQRLRFSNAPHLGRDLQALIPGNAAVLRRSLDTRSRAGVLITDTALCILSIRRAGMQLVLDVTALRPVLNGENGRFGFICCLVVQYQLSVRSLDGDSSVLAQLLQKVDVALLGLFHSVIGRVDAGFIHTAHAASRRDLRSDTGEIVIVPRFGFLGLAQTGGKGKTGGADRHLGRRAGSVHAVQLKRPGL